MTDEYVTAQEAAKHLGLKYTTLISRIHAGTVEAKRFGGWTWMVNMREIERILHDSATDLARPTR